jgi:hypothetical protein
MLYTKRPERTIEATIASQYVLDEKDSRPVNLLVSTLSGGGKTALLLERYGCVKGVRALGDVTYDQLAKKYLDQIYREEVRTLVLAEFNKVIGRKACVSRNTVGILSEMGEEGVPSIDLPYFQRTYVPPAKCSLIIGLTPSFLNAHLMDWWAFGFAQRFLLVTWNYSDAQTKQILQHIINQRHLKPQRFTRVFEDTKIHLPKKYADKLELYSFRVCEDMTNHVERLHAARGWKFDRHLERELPFRTQMRLQKFLKGLALLNGRTEVKANDVLEFQHLFEYMNCNFSELKD